MNLRFFLSQCTKKVVPIAAGSNCLFRAVSYLLFEDESAHWPLQELILWFEILNGSIFEKRMMDINESMFVQHIHPKVPLSNHCPWATNMEVYAIATYFQTPVYFCTDPHNLVLEVHTAGNTTGLLLTSPEVLRYPPFLDNAKTLELEYSRGCNYNSVVSVHTAAAHTFPTVDWQDHLP